MGQIIEVKTTKVNKTLIFDLNRSVSGQEGMTFNNISEASLIFPFECNERALAINLSF